MLPEAHVFIAMSLDGFIAEPDGGLDWLTGLPVPEGEDFGYADFIAGTDAMVMGRGTFDVVSAFDPWPYPVPVTVLSQSLRTIPPELSDRATLDAGDPRAVLERLGRRGVRAVYVDGGQVITAFLRADLVTRMTVTIVPVLLGRGVPLFTDAGRHALVLASCRSWENGFVQMVHTRTGV